MGFWEGEAPAEFLRQPKKAPQERRPPDYYLLGQGTVKLPFAGTSP